MISTRQRGMVPREHLAIAECSALPSAELLVEPPSALLRRSKVRAQCRRRKWRLIDDQPWRRAYVVLKPGAKDSFVAKTGS
jgi:hypothetical protein